MHRFVSTFILGLALTAAADGLAVPSSDVVDPPPALDAAAANQAVAQAMFQGNQHEADLLWPLLTHGARQCKRQAHRLGFRFFEVPGVSDDADAVIARNLGLSLGSTVDHVIPGSPLALAGLQAGDRVVSIDGAPVGTGRHAGRASNALLERATGHSGGTAVVRLQVTRGDDSMEIAAVPVVVCDYTLPVIALVGPLSAAQPGVLDIDVTAVHAAADDTDRTILLAHALGHQLDGDAGKRAGMATAGRAPDLVGSFTGHSGFGLAAVVAGIATRPGAEERADGASLPLLQAVGIAPARVVEFWVREATTPGHSPLASLLTAHPTGKARLAALEEAAGHVASAPAPMPFADVTAPVR